VQYIRALCETDRGCARLWDCVRLTETVWDCVTMWDWQRIQCMWDYVRLCETMWDCVRLTETMWDYVRLTETVWDPLRLTATVWDWYRPSEWFHQHSEGMVQLLQAHLSGTSVWYHYYGLPSSLQESSACIWFSNELKQGSYTCRRYRGEPAPEYSRSWQPTCKLLQH